MIPWDAVAACAIALGFFTVVVISGSRWFKDWQERRKHKNK